MRLINTLFMMMAFFSMTLSTIVQPVSAMAGGDEQTYYTTAIEAIIVNCESKQCLKESRSNHLRRCAEKAASKAQYLRRHKNGLVEAMVAEKLPLKRYRVERYVNAKFSDYHVRLSDN